MIENFSIVGVNYKTADISIREKLVGSFQDSAVNEIVPLFTCNRVEFYSAGGAAAIDTLSENLSVPELNAAVYKHAGESALRHLIRLGVGLDSMILGEPQIFGQLKTAYETSRKKGKTGHVLNRIFQISFDIIKEIRSKSLIAGVVDSVPAAAIAVAKNIYSDLAPKRVLIIGTGEMGMLTHELLAARGSASITILSRTEERAREIADRGLKVKTIADLDSELLTADIIVTCTKADKFVLQRSHLAKRVKSKPLLILDMGVPRNASPDLSEIENVFVWNVDMLQSVVQRETEQLKEKIAVIEEIVEQKVQKVMMEFRESSIGEVVKILNRQRESMLEEYSATNEKELGEIVDKLMKSNFHFYVRVARALRAKGLSEWEISKIFTDSLRGNRSTIS